MTTAPTEPIRLRATFLDEISTDIPHHNWGIEEWDRDFRAMKAIGIDTVVMIRCGLERFLTYPSEILIRERAGHRPPLDLLEMFLTLSEKHGMRFFAGTYVGQRAWGDPSIDYEKETDLDCRVAEEIWEKYGKHSSAFAGWYLSKELEMYKENIVGEFIRLGGFCKRISNGLPVMISPGMLGRHAWIPSDPEYWQGMNYERHEKDWDLIMGLIKGSVDIVAFQDGHCELDELPRALEINVRLARKHGLELWTNTESFDRDMPFRFPPVKWEKMLLKLKAAQDAGISRAITFEFSHFMSPYSLWGEAARGLYRRYQEYIGQKPIPLDVIREIYS